MTIRDFFIEQATACTALGSPFTGRLLTLLAQNLAPDTAIGARVLNWQGDASNRGDSVPLRLTGALHALVLQGKSAELIAAYPPNTVDDTPLWNAVHTALQTHNDQLQDWLNSPPQTNEVRRSAALMPAMLSLQKMFNLPLVISELGASAGLNLNWDHYGLTLNDRHFGAANAPVQLTPEWSGPLPPQIAPQVIDKAGCDLNPLDPVRDALRLRAYIWPDQPDRMQRTEAAIAIARQQNAPVARMDAQAWLKSRLTTRHQGAVHVVYHTVAWQYFPQATQDACAAALQQAGAAATPDAPLAHIAMEADGKGDGAGLTAQIWPGGQKYDLGRADFHGRWVKWRGVG